MEGRRLVKKLQNWFAIKHRSEISQLLESTKVEGNLLGRLISAINNLVQNIPSALNIIL